MKITYLGTDPDTPLYSSFMTQERYLKLHKILWLSLFRQSLYNGMITDLLSEVVEECQTLEEAVWVAMNIDRVRGLISQTLATTPKVTKEMYRLQAAPAGTMIAEKEALLREIEDVYNDAHKLWQTLG